jgi:hypothetical protein
MTLTLRVKAIIAASSRCRLLYTCNWMDDLIFEYQARKLL